MLNTNRAVIIVGNIGCGKSTITRELHEKDGVAVWDSDAITTMMSAGAYKFGKYSGGIIEYMKRGFIERCIKHHVSFVLDDPHMTASSRGQYIELIKTHNPRYIIECVDFGPGTKESLNRRLCDCRGLSSSVWGGVFNQLKLKYEQPCMNEAFNHIKKLW